MLKILGVLSCSALLWQPVFSQNAPPQEALIGTGTVQARITANGPLVADFAIRNTQDDSLSTVIREVSLWLGGIDPAGNLLLSIQRQDTALSDIRGGFLGIPNSAGVWKVTKKQIKEHRQDYLDNGVIDNPIPEIFAWPGRNNPYSASYNGFAVEGVLPVIAAPYASADIASNAYDPAAGDVPFFGSVIYNTHRIPDEMVFVPLHAKAESSAFPGTRTLGVDASAVFFTYYCDDAGFLDDAVFGYLNLAYPEDDRVDSFFLSFYVNGDIGDPADDYMGYSPNNSLAYFYTSDTLKSSTSGMYPPVAAFDLMTRVHDLQGFWAGVYSVMPIHPEDDPAIFAAIKEPELPVEFYRYMTGHWRDGTPLTLGGIGYGGNIPANYIFPGAPGMSAEWSEFQAGNEPGDRSALVSNGPGAHQGGYEQVLFVLEAAPGVESLSHQLKTLRGYSYDQETFCYGDFFPPAIDPYDTLPCFKNSTIGIPGLTKSEIIKVFPNPANEVIYLETEQVGIRSLALLDVLGKRVETAQVFTPGDAKATVQTANLPPGIYFLTGVLQNGNRFSRRVILSR